MDSLIHHCLREIAFDGDLGCDVSRLNQFIEEYYSGEPAQDNDPQVIDASFRSYVWSLVVQEPSVTVGLVPEGSSPVFIAPQPSAVRKQAKEQASAPSAESSAPAKLEALASAEIIDSNLPDLVERYGGTLRIAVDPEASFQAITGTHVRSPKLGAMTYTALQFITRSRIEGISMKGLGEATGYDQKTIHYLVSQLVDLGLIWKIRISGISKHACIHKYFYSKSRFYVPEGVANVEAEVDDGDNQSNTTGEDAVPSDSIFAHDPIDPKALIIDSVLRSRLTTLLKNSPNHLHRSENLILALGCPNPGRSDRRFVNHRVRVFMKEGWIEKVYAPNKKYPQSRVLCIRLVDQQETLEDEPLASAPDEDFEEAWIDRRTLDHMITKLLRDANPPHLGDLAIVQMRESLKREHRHKYYAVQHYAAMIEEMGTAPPAKTKLPQLDQTAIGGWGSFAEEDFYQSESDLLTKPPPNTRLVYNPTKPHVAPKRTNPIGPDGKYVKGRPRKEWTGGVSQPPRAKKKETEVTEGPKDEISSQPKKRGRKRKASEAIADGDDAGPADPAAVEPPPKKKRGRPKKSSQTKAGPAAEAQQSSASLVDTPLVAVTLNAGAEDAVMQVDPPTALSATVSPTATQHSTATTTVPPPSVDRDGIEVESAVVNVPNQEDANQAPSEKRGSSVTLTEPPAKRSRLDKGASSNQRQSETPKPSDALSILADTASRQPRGLGTNITYLRREKEILHLIAEDGGTSVADWTLTKRHTALVEQWDKEGRAVSGPAGTACDKRTMANLLKTMEDRGVIKKLVTTISEGGISRKPVTIIFTPDTAEDVMQAFVERLSNRINAAKTLPKQSYRYADADYSEVKAPSRNVRVNTGNADASRALASPFDTRMELLQDTRTCGQLFGFIAGRVARARELHLYTLSQLNDSSSESSPGIISKQDFIVATPYFWSDVPISTYCSIVSVNAHNAALEDLLANAEKRDTPVKDLPQDIRDALEIGRARCRYKVAEVLDLLQKLGVVVPLQSTESEAVNPNPNANLSFTIAQQARTPPVDVTYWQFNLIAPLYRYADTDKTELLGHVPIATVEESLEYWMACREAAMRKDYVLDNGAEQQIFEATFNGDSEIRRSITRFAAWSTEYRLSMKQMEYLTRFVDGVTGTIPLPINIEDPDDPFNVLCYAAAAPPSAVVRYLEHMSKDIKAANERTAKEQYRQQKALELQSDTRKLLALKVKEAKKRLQDNWDAAILAVHPDPLTEDELKSSYLLRLKRSYIAAGGNLATEALHDAIKEALSPRPLLAPTSSKARLPISRPGRKPREPSPIPVSAARGDDAISKVVLDLVNRQQPRKHETPKQRKERRAAEGPQKRGQRFLWNPDYDELAKDATCILAARCRASGTMSWLPMAQVFPGVDSNGVRTRISRMREDPATEGYMFKLEDVWYHLWMQKRGTDELPDSNPDNPTKFDLISHVVYLRKNIDKARLRCGSAPRTSTAPEIPLPSTVASLEQEFRVERTEERREDRWEQWFSTLGDESREKTFYKESLRLETASRRFEPLPELDCVAKGALRMLLETPSESYNVDVAAAMLGSCGEQHVANAISSSGKDNCITKVESDANKHVPGRQWRWQEWVGDSKSGPVQARLYSGAQSFTDELEAEARQDIPYVISDGVMVSLLNMVSEDKVALAVDTSHPAAVRHEVDGNSKKVVDDQLETSIGVRLRHLRLQDNDASQPSSTEPGPTTQTMAGIEPAIHSLPHGITSEPGPGVCCAELGDHTSYSIFNCDACLETSRWTILSGLGECDREWLEHAIEKINNAGPPGLSPAMVDLDNPRKYNLLNRLTSSTIPLAFWAGYTFSVLVGSKHAPAWTVSIPLPGTNEGSQVRMVLPRGWLDVHGNVIEKTWNEALRHVVGWVWLRPSISLLDLSLRVEPLFDRQETWALVDHLAQRDTLDLRWDSSIIAAGNRDLRSLTEAEAKKVWLIVKDNGKDPWYSMHV
ncbi:hypothetical protein FRB90_005745 [Tulasnella sp. 427]|nr:hypothetical protein FRB90_005745 [Tulasnella sp. 427]